MLRQYFYTFFYLILVAWKSFELFSPAKSNRETITIDNVDKIIIQHDHQPDAHFDDDKRACVLASKFVGECVRAGVSANSAIITETAYLPFSSRSFSLRRYNYERISAIIVEQRFTRLGD